MLNIFVNYLHFIVEYNICICFKSCIPRGESEKGLSLYQERSTWTFFALTPRYSLLGLTLIQVLHLLDMIVLSLAKTALHEYVLCVFLIVVTLI